MGTLSYDKLLVVIKQLRSRKRYKNTLEVSFWMSEKGYSKPGSADFSLRLNLIAKAKEIEEAKSYFDSIPKYSRAVECYSSHRNCYAQVRDVDKDERIILQMKHLGFAKSTLARNTLLNLYYQTQNFDKVENLLLEMKEEGIQFNRFTFVTLINTYAAKSDIEGIGKLLAQLEDDPSYSQHADWWSVYFVAANCYGKLGLRDKAFNVLKKSEERLSSTIWKEAFSLPCDLICSNRKERRSDEVVEYL
ncbi:pentatricopeptide repeat-containing protein At2g20710, mitochondrial-like [Arachis stenosperma]|uniref:pentatricopeptide repeat-containing protein At2g20710, mitochondrial-like n=1 Tax=Arachis stenosperma TaxID=217475 RepID=UPI0025AB8C7F|nr:pentatricopeptide repeat-containing protein At2g20710, mitochondrial-like [Arachis stenosperma]